MRHLEIRLVNNSKFEPDDLESDIETNDTETENDTEISEEARKALDILDRQKNEINKQARKHEGILSRLSEKGKKFGRKLAGVALISLPILLSGCHGKTEKIPHPERADATASEVDDSNEELRPIVKKRTAAPRTARRTKTKINKTEETIAPEIKVEVIADIPSTPPEPSPEINDKKDSTTETAPEVSEEKSEHEKIIANNKAWIKQMKKLESKASKDELAFAAALSSYIKGQVVPEGKGSYIVTMGGQTYEILPHEVEELKMAYNESRSRTKPKNKHIHPNVKAIKDNMIQKMKEIIARPYGQ